MANTITVDELRAMGALDVPEERRKSLGNSEKNLFSENEEEKKTSDNQKKRTRKEHFTQKTESERILNHSASE